MEYLEKGKSYFFLLGKGGYAGTLKALGPKRAVFNVFEIDGKKANLKVSFSHAVKKGRLFLFFGNSNPETEIPDYVFDAKNKTFNGNIDLIKYNDDPIYTD